MSTSAETRTARKAFPCGECRATVAVGDQYARHAAFPGDDANGGDRPLTLRLCRSCQTQYGQSMPSRRRPKVATQ